MSAVEVSTPQAQKKVVQKTLLGRCKDLIDALCVIPSAKFEERYINKFVDSDGQPLQKDDVHLHALFRQGGILCELINTHMAGVISDIHTLDCTSSITAADVYGKECKENVKMFLECLEGDYFKTADDLFFLEELYRNDVNTFVKCLGICEQFLEKIEKKKKISLGVLIRQKQIRDHRNKSGQRGSESDLNALVDTDAVVPQLNRRSKVIEEMYATEQSYVTDLDRLLKYMTEIKALKALTDEELYNIFANLHSLTEFGRNFALQMEKMMNLPPEDRKIGKLYIDNEQGFSVFAEYCGNYDVATNEVTNLRSTKLAEADALIATTQVSDSILKADDLHNYLIKPVQRLMRYPLLLKEIIKQSKEMPDIPELEAALEVMTRVSAAVNEEKRKKENVAFSKSLLNRVSDWKDININSLGELILHDEAFLNDDKDRKHLLCLFQSCIVIFKSVENILTQLSKKESDKLIVKSYFHTQVIRSALQGSEPDVLRISMKMGPSTTIQEVRLLTPEKVGIWKRAVEKIVADKIRPSSPKPAPKIVEATEVAPEKLPILPAANVIAANVIERPVTSSVLNREITQLNERIQRLENLIMTIDTTLSSFGTESAILTFPLLFKIQVSETWTYFAYCQSEPQSRAEFVASAAGRFFPAREPEDVQLFFRDSTNDWINIISDTDLNTAFQEAARMKAQNGSLPSFRIIA